MWLCFMRLLERKGKATVSSGRAVVPSPLDSAALVHMNVNGEVEKGQMLLTQQIVSNCAKDCTIN